MIMFRMVAQPLTRCATGSPVVQPSSHTKIDQKLEAGMAWDHTRLLGTFLKSLSIYQTGHPITQPDYM